VDEGAGAPLGRSLSEVASTPVDRRQWLPMRHRVLPPVPEPPAHSSLSPRAHGGSEFAGGAPACAGPADLGVSEQCGDWPRALWLRAPACFTAHRWPLFGCDQVGNRVHARAGRGGPSALMWRLYDLGVSRRGLSNPRPVFSRCPMSTCGAQGRSQLFSAISKAKA
jgi:hypothetical protein